MNMAKIPLSNGKPPTYAEVLEEILAPLQGPIALDELVDQVLDMRPSQAKKPRQAVRSQVRQQEGRLLVVLDGEGVLPLRLALQGVRFRIQLDRQAVETGLLPVTPVFSSYMPQILDVKGFELIDGKGVTIPVGFRDVSQEVETIFGTESYTITNVDLKPWFKSQKIFEKDHLLITVEDWGQSIFRIEHAPASKIDHVLLDERDRTLVDIIYRILESAAYDNVYQYEAIPKAYALLPDKGGYPPNHWMVALEADGRMICDGWCIQYIDSGYSPLEAMMMYAVGESILPPSQHFTKEAGEQVYCFKTQLKYNARIWRRIEIQGVQTLATFDRALREGFHHDTSDHLSGFWKLVARGGRKRTRYREVDLGSVDPLGGGEASKTTIAGLGLEIGDRLKYVYDFGDWIEHIITLESIEAPKKRENYPRLVAKNRPKYVPCVECQGSGGEAIAVWVCITCSNRKGEETVLCDSCADEHDDHYVEEILY